MRPSLRAVLADSHIAAVAIAVLLLWSLDQGFRMLMGPLARAIDFLSDRAIIVDIPNAYSMLGIPDYVPLSITLTYLFAAVACLAAAWWLSRWVYGVGPIMALSKHRGRLAGRNHV